ncbi:hypothetical protein SAMN05443999_12810, partial [Roseovarius azorensis]
CFAAGDALQFDWSEEYVLLGGVEHKVHVAHFRLCHSRKPFVVAYMNEKQEMVLDAFVRALASSTAETKPATWRRKSRPVAGHQAPRRVRSPDSRRGPWRIGPEGQFCKV